MRIQYIILEFVDCQCVMFVAASTAMCIRDSITPLSRNQSKILYLGI